MNKTLRQKYIIAKLEMTISDATYWHDYCSKLLAKEYRIGNITPRAQSLWDMKDRYEQKLCNLYFRLEQAQTF